MRFLFALILTAFVFSCKPDPGTLIWKADKNTGYYTCSKGGQVVENISLIPEYRCGIVSGNGELPTEFVFQFDSTANIPAIEGYWKTFFPEILLEFCPCNPFLAKASHMPIREIRKSGEKLTATSTTSRQGNEFDFELKNVLKVSPNYAINRELSDMSTTDKVSHLPANRSQQESTTTLVRVAILDTGYDPDAAFGIKGKLKTSDCLASSPIFTDTRDADTSHHGTFVTALFLKGIGEASYSAEIIPARVLEKDGTGSFFKLICALSSLKGQKIDIINASLGYYAPKDDHATAEFLASYINDTESWFFAAAGNEDQVRDSIDLTLSRDLSVRNLRFFPACLQNLPRLITVTSCTQQDDKQFKVCSSQNFSREFVDVAVVANTACKIGFETNPHFFGRGSSFATPIAAGKAAARIVQARQSQNGSTTPDLLNDISQPAEWLAGRQQTKSNRIIWP